VVTATQINILKRSLKIRLSVNFKMVY